MSTFLTLTLWVLIGFATSYTASKRGRDPIAWFGIGILLGLLGFLLLMILPPLNVKKEEDESSSTVLVVTPQLLSPVQDYQNQQWFCIDKERQQKGPLTYDEIKTLWDEDKIDASTFVWCEGMPEWKKLSDLKEFHQALQIIRD